MIVDVHSHLSTLEQWGTQIQEAVRRTYPDTVQLHITPERHQANTAAADKVIVFGINALHLDMHTPNDSIADYVRSDPDRLIGFMSIDPNQPDALDELERSAGELGLRGIKMSPVYQNFDPTGPMAAKIHARAEELGLPILTHAAFQGMSKAPMQWANPLNYDPVGREFPDLKVILAHIGIPWFIDAMTMVRKHQNFYTDITTAYQRPWWMYQALAAFHEFGMMHKLLFGSDFPFGTQEDTLKGLRNINSVVQGTGLPRIPEEDIEAIIHRDSLALLGLD
ncbi:MAG: amidohydrolase family protein [Chloroflexi bacterium]|nr:amidohydrolase family protein [Chloroflexota bacterium]MCY3938977.1 amidohydrolase family protein [Chloroflexota bacterium]